MLRKKKMSSSLYLETTTLESYWRDKTETAKDNLMVKQILFRRLSKTWNKYYFFFNNTAPGYLLICSDTAVFCDM